LVGDPTDLKAMMIPLLGLAGEAGELLSEYKKYLRDGDSHRLFRERYAEELGDMLWYLANVATKFGLNLAEVAEQNLAKSRGRFGEPTTGVAFDDGFPDAERFPRLFQVDFNTVHDKDDRPRMLAFYKGEPFGDPLTDNAYWFPHPERSL
jgi:NTP pyrophosphatase (non-canonical NTP hydrolase)